jgi:hypothetical protein
VARVYDGDSARGFAAMERGVFLRIVDHDRYAAEFMPMMRSEYQCPHGGTA